MKKLFLSQEWVGYSVIVALTGLPIEYSVIVALTSLTIEYSVIVALIDLIVVKFNLAKQIFRTLFLSKPPEKNELFQPGRMVSNLT